MKRMACVSLIAATTMSAGCSWIAERHLVSTWKNQPAPDFELADLDGQRVKLSGFRGQPVIISFWTST